MNLLVCISKTPDTTTKISFTDNNTQFDTDRVQYIMNPYDEWYALVRALELKEEFGGTVTLINVGGAENDPIIRKGLAIGADKAVRIDAAASSAFFVAKQIAEHAKSVGYDIIFTGKETIDYNGSVVGASIAELLDAPFISYASSLKVEDGKHVIERDIEGGKEVLEVEGLYVMSAAKGLAEQRIANMRGIMMAKRKPIDVTAPVAVEEKETLTTYTLPQEKSEVKMIDPENMSQLVELLHSEAKVI